MDIPRQKQVIESFRDRYEGRFAAARITEDLNGLRIIVELEPTQRLAVRSFAGLPVEIRTSEPLEFEIDSSVPEPAPDLES